MKRDLEIRTDIHLRETELLQQRFSVVATLGSHPIFPGLIKTGGLDIRLAARHEDIAVDMDRGDPFELLFPLRCSRSGKDAMHGLCAGQRNGSRPGHDGDLVTGAGILEHDLELVEIDAAHAAVARLQIIGWVDLGRQEELGRAGRSGESKKDQTKADQSHCGPLPVHACRAAMRLFPDAMSREVISLSTGCGRAKK
ncbi:hypothetical protein D3C78_1259140 [compost metagenome]